MLRVLVPPEPIVTPGDVPGDHVADDASVAAIIAAVTETIDGPNGWLGRALGEQTLELAIDHFPRTQVDLPCRPIIEVEAIVYLDATGTEHTLADPDDVYRVIGSTLYRITTQDTPAVGNFPDGVRVQYRAGYDGAEVADGGTGEVPAAAKQAIILSTQHLLNVGAENLYTSAETVDGIGTTQYVVSQQASQLIETTCDRLLQGLRVYK